MIHQLRLGSVVGGYTAGKEAGSILSIVDCFRCERRLRSGTMRIER